MADDKVLRVGTEGAYPPFNFADEKGELAGFDVDIAKAICKAMETKCLLPGNSTCQDAVFLSKKWFFGRGRRRLSRKDFPS